MGSSIGGLKQSKRAGDGPKWWNHENDSSAARRGAAQWRRGREAWCARCAGRPRCGARGNVAAAARCVVRQQQRATAARPLGVTAVRLRIRLATGGRLGATASGVLRRPRRRGGHGLVRGGLPGDPAWARDGECGGGRGCGGLGRDCQ